MDKLILDYLKDKIEGESIESICLEVAKFFSLGHVKIEEHVGHMVDEKLLQFFHVGNSARYAVNPKPYQSKDE